MKSTSGNKNYREVKKKNFTGGLNT